MNAHWTLATEATGALKQFVDTAKLHPILVNFTAALVPVSLAFDIAAKVRREESLRQAAWWTLVCATFITPFTALTGWLFWMPDDAQSTGMGIHKWLGTALALLLLLLFAWRLKLHRQSRRVTLPYLIAESVFIIVLILQGYLGGTQVFGGM